MPYPPFKRIAIVAQSCLLPGCFVPKDLWHMVRDGLVATGPAPDAAWRISMDTAIGGVPGNYQANRAWSEIGGYVRGFDAVFDFDRYRSDIARLDPMLLWSLHCAGQCLDSVQAKDGLKDRTSVILGNLAYPNAAFGEYVEDALLAPALGRNSGNKNGLHRYMAAGPAHTIRRELSLGGKAFCLDAACASGLYAIKIACDMLHRRQSDMVLAGAVNCTDPFFLHVGFCALGAKSRSGQSRPFHEDADGLIPSEGAACIAMKRLDDALASGDDILGVIRGIGLSNDGRTGGFLAPAKSGQVRAMEQALEQACLDPSEINLLECHATGTPGGDKVELESIAHVYGGNELVLSSLKANLGHLITVSGVAGLQKVLGCMEHGVYPPTPNAFPTIDFKDGSHRVLKDCEPWELKNGRRVAAISSFGFGGNNAHLIVEQWKKKGSETTGVKQTPTIPSLAVLAVDIQTDKSRNIEEFYRVMDGRSDATYDQVEFDLAGLNFPPQDLQAAIGQQLMMMQAGRHAMTDASVDPSHLGIYIGMDTDPDASRYAMRARLSELLEKRQQPVTESTAAAERIATELNAAAVVGCMPNIPANRLHSLFDAHGPGFTVADNEQSGITALELAAQALMHNEIDAALVGAVDMGRHPVHQKAMAQLKGSPVNTGDAAVALLVKRCDTLTEDDPVLFRIDWQGDGKSSVHIDNFGHLHAAESLFQLTANGLLIAGRAMAKDQLVPRLPKAKPSEPVAFQSLRLSADKASGGFSMPVMATYTADGVKRLISRVRDGHESQTGGPVRLAIVCSADAFEEKRELAIRMLADGYGPGDPQHQGIFFYPQALEGELAFAFTGAASAYPDMARELLLARPDLVERMRSRLTDPATAAAWVYEKGTGYNPGPFEQLTASSFLCQLHAEITLNTLNLRPDAMIGLSSGETNGVFALGAWTGDMSQLFKEIDASGMYTQALANSFEAVREHLHMTDDQKFAWENWRILIPVERLQEAVADEAHAWVSIINHDNDGVLCGSAEACSRILDKLGRSAALPLGHDMAVHCEVVKPFEAVWYDLHHRPSAPVEDVRFYSNWLEGVYEPHRDNIAQALTGQATRPIDFRRIVEQAWKDGVRIFVEHGPRNSLSQAISRILGPRPHLTIPLDIPHESSRHTVANAAAHLWCAGYDLNLDGLAGPRFEKAKTVISLPMHMPKIELQDLLGVAERILPAAPELAPVHQVPGPPPVQAKPVLYDVSARGAAQQPAEQEANAAAILSRAQVGRAAVDAQQVINIQQHLFAAHTGYIERQKAALQRYDKFNARIAAVLTGAMSAATAEPLDPISQKTVAEPPAIPSVDPPDVKLIKTAPTASAAIERQTVQVDKGVAPAGYPGPAFSREQLIHLASDRISDLFGPEFREQDKYAIQVRMPEPPLLLCDRVLGIEGEPGAMGLGTIWTETDVTEGSFYLHHGRMPAGYMIEAGQADLLLISWLGIDKLNKGERTYRLLGCELTFHGDLPKPGDTLHYDIHVDGHAAQGDVRLFFFHYDCRIDGEVRLSVRNGQAGFFTRSELDHSAGILWEPEAAEYTEHPRLMASPLNASAASYSVEQVDSLTNGDLAGCFGPAFMPCSVHTRTPTLAAGNGCLLQYIDTFDPLGGPKGRGYLRAEFALSPDDWFFDGHFKNDPCMPGTLMAEASLQAMAFYMIAHGHTLHRDGWRFQPLKERAYTFICRGQALPESTQLVYEVFVDELYEAPLPTLKAHVLCSVDGQKAFLCQGLAIELVPNFPISSMPEVLPDCSTDTRPLAHIGDLPLDGNSLTHCAVGDPHKAFGPGFTYLHGKRTPRLPGMPYHFMTRITEVRGPFGRMSEKPEVVALYDIPADAWYFNDNPSGVMPWCVLMEIGLQPCGWLASYTGCTFDVEGELLFRNLDGTAIQHRDVLPTDSTIQTEVTMLSKSALDKTIIVSFHVKCRVDGEELLVMDTTFGFFPPEGFRNQKGLPPSEHDLKLLHATENVEVDFNHPNAQWQERLSIFSKGKLLLLDRIDGYAPNGGKAGKGWMRGRMDIRGDEWFFKAHFFQDPVQPGSLGVEAMLQVMQAWMLKQDYHKRFEHPVFEPIFLGMKSEWHYRGQVVPWNRSVTVEIEIIDEEINEDHILLTSLSRYWVDGLKIYEVPCIGIRIKEDDTHRHPDDSWSLSLEENPWIKDHCPTFVLPCMPMMGALDMMISAAHQHYHRDVVQVCNFRILNWLRFEADTCSGCFAFEEKKTAVLTRLILEDGTLAAEAEIYFEAINEQCYQPEPLKDPIVRELPYANGFFHGPSFHLMTEWTVGANGASALVQVESLGVPINTIHPGLLDASLHCIPHDGLSQWESSIPADHIAYPVRLNSLRFFAPWPENGFVRVEVRYCGLAFNTLPKFLVVIYDMEQKVLADYELLETVFPRSALAAADGRARHRFLHRKAYVPGLSLSRENSTGHWILDDGAIARADWLPGTVKRIYGIEAPNPKKILQKEIVSSAIGLHPHQVCFDATANCRNLPFNPCPIEIPQGSPLRCAGFTPPELNTGMINAYWQQRGAADSPLLSVTSALCRAFVRRVILQDPDDFAAQETVMFLANHQVGIESFLFLTLMAVLKDQNMLAVAKAEHRKTWVGALMAGAQELFGDPPIKPVYFDRERQNSFLEIIKDLAAHKDKNAVLIHVEGTRASQAGVPVQRASSVLTDLSVNANIPIVPVRFVGGLNTRPSGERLEFPYQFGMQDIYVGRTIRPEQLSGMGLKERSVFIIDSINLLGPPLEIEKPIQGRISEAVAVRLADGWATFPAVIAAAMELSGSDPMLEELNKIGASLNSDDLFTLLQQLGHPKWRTEKTDKR